MPTKASETRFKRILRLGTARLALINRSLAAGESPTRLARRIQNEWNQLVDTPTATLAKQLARYRAAIVPTLVAGAKPGQSGIHQEPSAFAVHDRLVELVLVQRERVHLGRARELQAGFPIPTLTKEIQALGTMLTALAKLQFELGILEYKGPPYPPASTGGHGLTDAQVAEAVSSALATLDKYDATKAWPRDAERYTNPDEARL